MDAGEYKHVTASADVFRVTELDATVSVLRAGGSSLAEVLAAAPRTEIPRPIHHSDPSQSDFVRVDLPLELVTDVVGELLDAEAAAVSPNGETSSEASRRADLVDRWGRYQRSLEQRHDR